MVVGGRVVSRWLSRYVFRFGRLVVAGGGVVMIGIAILVLAVILIDRRRSDLGCDEIRVRLLLDEIGSTM